VKYFYSALAGFAFVVMFSFAALIASIAWMIYFSLRTQGEAEVGWDLITMFRNLGYPGLLLVPPAAIFAIGFIWNFQRLSKLPPSAL